MDVALQIGLNAVIAGAIYSLVTLGFNLTYSTARFFDLSYGAVAAAGGYVVLYLTQTLGQNLYLSILLGVLFAGALSFIIELTIFRPLRKKKATHTVLLIASLGVLSVIQAAIAIFFGSQFHTLVQDLGAIAVFHVGSAAITQSQTLILVVAVAIMFALGFALKYTRFGKAVVAIADDEEVAQIVGINTDHIISSVFFIGGAIAGIAGIGIGFDSGLLPTLGLAILLKGVIGAIIGGIGNVYGSVLGAFLLAIVENLGAWQFSGEWRDAIAFFVLIAFLLFRPRGILPR